MFVLEFKDCKNLRNNDIKLYMIDLQNEYDKVKREIKEKIEYLDTLDREYNKAENEINLRRNSIY